MLNMTQKKKDELLLAVKRKQLRLTVNLQEVIIKEHHTEQLLQLQQKN